MVALHAARRSDVEAGRQAPRVDWPVYPRRAEHNTVAEGGNRRWAETARQNTFQSERASSWRRPLRRPSKSFDRRLMSVAGGGGGRSRPCLRPRWGAFPPLGSSRRPPAFFLLASCRWPGPQGSPRTAFSTPDLAVLRRLRGRCSGLPDQPPPPRPRALGREVVERGRADRNADHVQPLSGSRVASSSGRSAPSPRPA